MDFERGVLSAFFYDYPLSNAIDILGNGITLKNVLQPVSNLLRWRLSGFNNNECKLWTESLHNRFKESIKGTDGVLLPFMLLHEVGENLMNCLPLEVKEGQLLRWHDLTLLLGEDLMVCSTLAKRDINNHTAERSNFLWPDHLVYSNSISKNVTSAALYDVHAHIDSTSDAFDISWIERMNQFNIKRGASIENVVGLELETFKILKPSQEKVVAYWADKYSNKSYMDWVSLAAILRYWVYSGVVNHAYPINKDLDDIKVAINDSSWVNILLSDYYKRSDAARQDSPKPAIDNVKHWDYALPMDMQKNQSPFMLYWGERRLYYLFFYQLYKEPVSRNLINLASVFYLYVLIKIRARKEVIQTNSMTGLSNYQVYQDSDMKIRIEKEDELHYRYAIQSAIGKGNKNYLECRINPQKVENLQKARLSLPFFSKAGKNIDCLEKRVTIVGSFTKSHLVKAKNRQYSDYRNNLKVGVDKLCRVMRGRLKVTGIDFSGSDTKIRPEVFTEAISYARFRGIKHFTYHAGEDFYDIVDGMRTIDDTITYLGFNSNCRLGHCLALFTDVEKYYNVRHNKSLVPMQMLLDNLVWLSEMATVNALVVPYTITSSIITYYGKIGYPGVYNHKDYVASMRLRGMVKTIGELPKSPAYAKALDSRSINAKTSVAQLYDLYVTDEAIYENGMVLVQWNVTKVEIRLVKEIQKNLLRKVCDKGIGIETCPTSNKNIGWYDCYRETPSVSLIDKGVFYSINTDDKGILATNIETEYALVCASIQKDNRFSDAQLQTKLDKIKRNAKRMKFN